MEGHQDAEQATSTSTALSWTHLKDRYLPQYSVFNEDILTAEDAMAVDFGKVVLYIRTHQGMISRSFSSSIAYLVTPCQWFITCRDMQREQGSTSKKATMSTCMQNPYIVLTALKEMLQVQTCQWKHGSCSSKKKH
jgi:hypothetical protein